MGPELPRGRAHGRVQAAHRRLRRAESDSVALTVTGAGLLVIQALEARDPDAAAKIPEGMEARLTAVSEGDFGEAVTDLVQVAEDIEAVGWVALARGPGLLRLGRLRRAAAGTPRARSAARWCWSGC